MVSVEFIDENGGGPRVRRTAWRSVRPGAGVSFSNATEDPEISQRDDSRLQVSCNCSGWYACGSTSSSGCRMLHRNRFALLPGAINAKFSVGLTEWRKYFPPRGCRSYGDVPKSPH